MNRILIYIDPHHPADSAGLLGAAAQIAAGGRLVSYAFCPGAVAEEIDGRFDYCIWMPEAPFEMFDTANLAACFEDLQREYRFDAILLPATRWGRALAPRVAMRLGVGLVADITAVEQGGGHVRLVRPAFDGKLLAVIECSGKNPLMASIRAGVFQDCGVAGITTERIPFFRKKLAAPGIRLLAAEEKLPPADIRESEILVSGGGGVGHGIARLTPLAEALHGMVSASRRIVDDGIAPRAIQVGQSGKTVSPKLYFALGIYGSLQHIEGLKNVGGVISVNTNRYAPICSLSDIVVVGDAVEFAEKLAEKIKRRERGNKAVGEQEHGKNI